MIKAPSNVLMTDLEYGLDLFMTGKITVHELRNAFPDTVMIDQHAAGTILKNPTMLNITADANGTDPITLSMRVNQLLNTEAQS